MYAYINYCYVDLYGEKVNAKYKLGNKDFLLCIHTDFNLIGFNLAWMEHGLSKGIASRPTYILMKITHS